jgi:hypothetical protein
MKLKDVLARYSGSGPHFGEKFEGEPDQDAANALSLDLKAVSDQNRVFFLVCVGMVLAIFVGACTVAVRYIPDPTFVKEVFAAAGVSLTGLVAQMLKLWKEKVRSDMVLVLARNLSPKDIRGILEVLLKS